MLTSLKTIWHFVLAMEGRVVQNFSKFKIISSIFNKEKKKWQEEQEQQDQARTQTCHLRVGNY